jgi:hypothetical protein
MALFLRIAAGDLQLRGIARRARRAVDAEWLDLAREESDRLRRRPVELLESAETDVPITWGFSRSRIVLPEGASRWPLAQKRAVLIHELAHVQRHDALTQLVARIACALHWPNPLAWIAAREMRAERERACDDRVLRKAPGPPSMQRAFSRSRARRCTPAVPLPRWRWRAARSSKDGSCRCSIRRSIAGRSAPAARSPPPARRDASCCRSRQWLRLRSRLRLLLLPRQRWLRLRSRCRRLLLPRQRWLRLHSRIRPPAPPRKSRPR